MSTVKDEIAKNLLYYRKKAGYTQKELAVKLGVKNTAVSNWEGGNNSIDIETLFAACEIFGVTLNDMYGKYSAAPERLCADIQLAPNEVAHIQKYRQLDRYGKIAVDAICDIELQRLNDGTVFELPVAARNGDNAPAMVSEKEKSAALKVFNAAEQTTDL